MHPVRHAAPVRIGKVPQAQLADQGRVRTPAEVVTGSTHRSQSVAQAPEYSGTWGLFKFPLPPVPLHPEAGCSDDPRAFLLTAGLTIQATVQYLRGRVALQTHYIEREWRADQAP